jgi:hypothetical protein
MPKFNGYENELEHEANKISNELVFISYNESDFFSVRKLPLIAKLVLFAIRFFLVRKKNPNENKVFIKARDFFLKKKAFAKFNSWIESQVQGDFDCLLVIKGFGISAKVISNIIAGHKVIYQWDVLEHFPSTKEIYPLFDLVFTFDPADAELNHWEYLPNYYIKSEVRDKKYAVVFVGTYSKLRFDILNKLAVHCESIDCPFFIKLYHPTLSDGYIITNEKISKDEYREAFETSKFVFEISKPEQNGYSQRYLEALSNESRVIVYTDELINSNGVISLSLFMTLSKENIFSPYDFSYDPATIEFMNICRIDNWLKKLVVNINA